MLYIYIKVSQNWWIQKDKKVLIIIKMVDWVKFSRWSIFFRSIFTVLLKLPLNSVYLFCIRTLLEYGALVGAESKAGFTPLHLAAQESAVVRARRNCSIATPYFKRHMRWTYFSSSLLKPIAGNCRRGTRIWVVCFSSTRQRYSAHLGGQVTLEFVICFRKKEKNSYFCPANLGKCDWNSLFSIGILIFFYIWRRKKRTTVDLGVSRICPISGSHYLVWNIREKFGSSWSVKIRGNDIPICTTLLLDKWTDVCVSH
jgi:hypothetical protein